MLGKYRFQRPGDLFLRRQVIIMIGAVPTAGKPCHCDTY
jgi:hypothetical protein